MKLNLAKELAALEQMTVGQLQQRYAEVFGETVRSRHKQYLIRRIAWRLQANAAGLSRPQLNLSGSPRQRATVVRCQGSNSQTRRTAVKGAYRKGARRTSRSQAVIVERADLSPGNVSVELPVSLAAAVEGVTAEVEQLAGQAGVLIMQAVMDAEVEPLAGPRGRHEPQRPASRWGRQAGDAVLGGRKVRLARPRVRDAAGHELGLPSCARFQSEPRRQASGART